MTAVHVDCLRFWRVAAALLILAAAARSNAVESDPKSQDLTRTARDISDQGLAHYQRGEFDAAIESFMEAFALSNNPGLLFNVAQAYRLKRDCGRAKEYYQRYYDLVPDSGLKSSIARRLDEMESCLRTSATAAANPPGPAPARPGAPPAAPALAIRAADPSRDLPRSPPRTAPQNHRAITWTLRGSAAVLLASSAVFGALAWNAHGDVDDTSLQRPAVEANERYQRDSALAWTFAVSGVACGIIAYFVGGRP